MSSTSRSGPRLEIRPLGAVAAVGTQADGAEEIEAGGVEEADTAGTVGKEDMVVTKPEARPSSTRFTSHQTI